MIKKQVKKVKVYYHTDEKGNRIDNEAFLTKKEAVETKKKKVNEKKKKKPNEFIYGKFNGIDNPKLAKGTLLIKDNRFVCSKVY